MMDEQMLREAVAAYLQSCKLRVSFTESHVYYDDSKLEISLEDEDGKVLFEATETFPSWERARRSDW